MRALLAIAFVACAGPARVIVIHDPCDQRAMRPAVACKQGQLGYDGCRWGCTLEPVSQEPAHIHFEVNGFRVEAEE